MHICGRGLPTRQIRSKSEKTFCGRTDGQTDGRTRLPIVDLLGHGKELETSSDSLSEASSGV